MRAALDTSNANLSEFVRIFGSESVMQKYFPKTHQAYKNSINARRNRMLGGAEQARGSAVDYLDIDIIHVGYTDSTKKTIQVDVVSNSQNDDGYSLLDIKAVDSKTSGVVSQDVVNTFVGNVQKSSILIPTEGIALKNVLLSSTAYTIDSEVRQYNVLDSIGSYLLNATSTFTICKPKKTHTSTTNNDINIAYRTKGMFSEDKIDYFYSYAEMQDGQLRIPSKGEIKVSGIRLDRISRCELSVENAEHTKRYHMNAEAACDDNTTITWDMPANWGFQLTEVMPNLYEYLTYTLSIIALESGRPCTFIITSDQTAVPSNNKHIIPNKIYVYKDCFVKGTKISIPGGGEKTVESLKKGDRVLSENNQAAVIGEITCVKRPCLLAHITDGDGKEIFTTSGHPFQAKDGLRCAFLLSSGDTVKTIGGEKKVSQVCILPEEETELYSVTVNGGGSKLYANGFLVGDSATELTEVEKATNMRYRVPQEWRGDYDSWGTKIQPPSGALAKGKGFFDFKITDEAELKEGGLYSSVQNIEDVQISGDGDSFVYYVNTDKGCTGNIKVIISASNSSNPAKRLEAVSEWYDLSGSATIKKSLLAGKTDLYLYLLDEDTGVVSDIVKVYFAQPVINRCEISGGALVFYTDKDNGAAQLSSKMIINYTSPSSMSIAHDIPLPEARITFRELDIWRDTQRFKFRLSYFMNSGGVKVYSAPTAETTVYIAPPEVTGVSLSKNKLTATGTFASGVTACADLMLGGERVKTFTLSETNDFELAGVILDETRNYTVCFYYKTDTGTSLRSGALPVVTAVPVVTSCEYSGGNAVVSLAEHAVYNAVYGDVSQDVAGESVTVPKSVEKIKLRAVVGTSVGEQIEYTLSSPAYYPLETSGGLFYSMQDGPDKLKAGEDIAVALNGLPAATAAYSGTYFVVESGGERVTLTIKKEIYTAAANLVRADFTAMLKKYDGSSLTISALRGVVKNKLPMRADDLLFFNYDYCPADGYTGITEGMSLFTEYAVYQNIPGASAQDLSGFVGTGTARYQVVARGGRTVIEPFASSVNFTVNPPQTIKSDNKLCGGAGVADLLYSGFSAAHLRLVYPIKFADRTSSGDLVYCGNICLIASNSLESLTSATVNMRRGALSVSGAAYNYFRGRSVVIPQIKITVNGNEEWVSLGTTLQDVSDARGADKAAPILKRRSEKGLCRLYYANKNMPLMMGDTIDV